MRRILPGDTVNPTLKIAAVHTHDLTFTTTEVHKRYVSWDRGEADREWACLTLLAEHAPGIAPTPLRRTTDAGHPVIITERLPGEPLGSAPLTPGQTSALGGALRPLYDIPPESIRIGERRFGPTNQTRTVGKWLSQPHDLHGLRDPNLVTRAIRTTLDRLPTTDPHLVAHGIADLNPANIVGDGRTCRLVDFEDAALTDPAYELADHIEHIAGRGIFDPDALVDAVGLTTGEGARMRTYRPLFAAYWLVLHLPGNAGFRRNPPGTTEAQAAHLLALLA
ncbi:MAG TPA: aminoglycoside phosphotransferase family protein [Pseudonocardiaceae bacterium]|jgi:aminoglycoside phosphotransferase (APT) family kinase protein